MKASTEGVPQVDPSAEFCLILILLKIFDNFVCLVDYTSYSIRFIVEMANVFFINKKKDCVKKTPTIIQ